MRRKNILHKRGGQTAIEYMLLFGTVVAAVLIGLKTYVPDMQEAANVYFDRASVGILGEPTPCGDGVCTPGETLDNCPIDC